MSRLKVNYLIPYNDFGIGIGLANTEESAILNIQSSTQGIYLPKLTSSQRSAISNPKDGLLVYNTDSHSFEHYNSSTSLWEPVSGIQSLNGISARDQLLTNGYVGTSPNWTQFGGNTNVLNIPMANQSAVSAGLLTNGEWLSFNQRLYPAKNILYVVKNDILGPQDFNSIKEAVESITDASSSNPYRVVVAPGIYVENQIQMQSYVWIEGAEQDQTIIQASNPNQPLILGEPSSGISKCLITGVTGSGISAILYASSAGSDKESFFVEDVRFGNNDTHVIADSTNSQCAVFVEEGRLGGNYQFNTGFVARNGGRIVMRNSTTTSVSLPVPQDVFYADGTGSEIVLNGVQLRNGNSTSGNCIRLRNGAKLRALSFNIKNWNKGIWIENVGSACFVDVIGILCEGNNYDLVADHPGSDGTFTGSADHTKLSINSSAPLSVVIACNAVPSDNTGSVTLGDILQADRLDRIANLSLLARKATTLGVIEDVSMSFILFNTGLNVEIVAGKGFLNDPTDIYLKEINWTNTIIALDPNSTNYIYVDSNGTIQSSPTYPSLETVILLGRVNTNASDIRFIENSNLPMNHYGNKTERFLRDILGPVFESGCLITENAIPLKINATSGSYRFGITELLVSGGSAITWESFYRDGSGGFQSLGIEDTLSNSLYDDGSGTLQSIPSGYYARHHLYVVGDDGNERWFLVYAQDVYSSSASALNSPLPIIPSFMTDAVVRIAGIIVQEGNPNIVDPIVDVRPRLGFAAPSGTAVTDHGSLTGLLDDDHPQYLKADGTRVMSGDLNMGGNDIASVGLVDGVDISAHASRHLPNGADPLTTAAPLTSVGGNTVNSTGTANSLARSDHQHAIATGAASTQVPDQANAAGTSNNLARADHVHNIPAGTPITALGGNSTNSKGVAASVALSDHTHDIDTGVPSAVLPGNSNAEGTSNNLARADHTHAVPVGTPISISTANSAGSANSFARSDHQHSHGNIPGGSTHDAATQSVNGFMSAADKTKLDNLAASNVPFTPVGNIGSTNTQSAIAELDSEKQAVSEKGQANGYASLDGSGKVPLSQLPDTVIGSVEYKGTWNANTNTPNLGGLTPDKGDYYVVNVNGSTSLGGITDWKIGDWAIYNGTTWEKVDNTDQVSSVNGYQGVVVLTKSDVGLGNVDNTSDANKPVSTAQAAADSAVQAFSIQRANHTGTQLASTISNFASTVLATVLTGISFATNSAITATDSILVAFGKLQAQISGHFGVGGTTHPNATTSVAGFMSASDKTKLDGIASGINTVYHTETSAGGQTISTATFVDVTNASRTAVDAGTYLVIYEGVFTYSNASRTADIIVNVGGTDVTASQRSVSSAAGGQIMTISTHTVVTVTANTIIKIRAQLSSNTMTVNNQSLSLLKIA